MQANLEVLEGLARRLEISVPRAEVEAEVQRRLKALAKNVKVPGFRPGKAPAAIVARQYAPGVRQEVLGELLQKRFSEAVAQLGLRVAGYPRFESRPAGEGDENLVFDARFEVYPDVAMGELGAGKIVRPVVTVADSEVDKTLAVLQKQRRSFEAVDRAAETGDLVKFDYHATIDGQPFPGGEGQDFTAVIGEGRLLKDFEQNLVGIKAGETREFDLTFPADYAAKEIAGKTAHFSVAVKEVQAPVLPAVDSAFAQALGVEDGDVEKLRAEVKANLEREVGRRVKTRLKEQVMDLLVQSTNFDVPQSLVEMEIERLRRMTEADMQARGLQSMKLSADMFQEQAERRVRLGLILADIIQKQDIKAGPEQVRALVEEQAQSYEEPEEVVHWYYQNPERMQEIESLALEENVVAWVMGQAQVEDVVTSFDELMGRA
jgi:trigger factor